MSMSGAGHDSAMRIMLACSRYCLQIDKGFLMGKPDTSHHTRPEVVSRAETRQPPMFKVLMHNDDYTTMEFVVETLVEIFHKSPTEANRIMLHIHFKGLGSCGVYPFEVAETKVAKVHALARSRGYPLRCSMDPV